MDPKLKQFKYDSIDYTISMNDTVMLIQIIKNNQRVAEQTYTIQQLIDISSIFYM